MLAPLSPVPAGSAEALVIEGCRDGHEVDVSACAGGPRVRAELLRRLLLGLPLDPGGEPLQAPGNAGLCVIGAEIAGHLDISDCQGRDGASLPAIRFHRCKFVPTGGRDASAAAIDASHARLQRLSLKGSRFHYVDLSDAALEGDLDLRDTGPLISDGECRIKARDIAIAGNVKADGIAARALCGPPLTARTRQPIAMDLGGARIDASVYLIGSQVLGSVRLRNAHIRGDVRIVGGTIANFYAAPVLPPTEALDLQTARIDGNLMVAPDFDQEPPCPVQFRGCIHLFGCQIGGTVQIEGAAFGPPDKPESQDAPSEWNALTMGSARIGGRLSISSATAPDGEGAIPTTVCESGRISLSSLSAVGDVNVSVGLPARPTTAPPASSVSSPTDGTTASGGQPPQTPPPTPTPTPLKIDLDRSKLGGNLLLWAFPGDVSLLGTIVDGDLNFLGCESLPNLKLEATGLRLGGRLTMLLAATKLAMAGAQFGQFAFIGKVRASDPFGSDEVQATPLIDLSGSRFDSDLLFVPHLAGKAMLRQLKVGGQLQLGTDGEIREDLLPEGLFKHYVSWTKKPPSGEWWAADFCRCLSLMGNEQGERPALELDLEDSEIAGSLVLRGIVPYGRSDALPVMDWGPARTKSLKSLPGFHVLEVSCTALGGNPVTIAWLVYDGSELLHLTGDSSQLHVAMRYARAQLRHSLRQDNKPFEFKPNDPLPDDLTTLGSEGLAKEWLRVFCTYVFRDDAVFRIIETMEDAHCLLDANDRRKVKAKLVPMTIKSERGKGWDITCGLLYIGKYYEAHFKVGLDGVVSMIEDRELVDTPSLRRSRSEWPFREGYLVKIRADKFGVPPPLADFDPRPDQAIEKCLDAIKELKKLPATVSGQLEVSLRGVHAGELDDMRGEGWFSHGRVGRGAPANLDMDGFVYRSTSETTKEKRGGQASIALNDSKRKDEGESTRSSELELVDLRLKWLKLQYEKYPPDRKDFSAQPWEQLGRVLRDEGNLDEARKIFREKMRVERLQVSPVFNAVRDKGWLRKLRQADLALFRWHKEHVSRYGLRSLVRNIAFAPIRSINEHFFGFGLSSARAVLSCVAVVLIGWHGVEVANSGIFRPLPYGGSPFKAWFEFKTFCPVLVTDSFPVSTMALDKSGEAVSATPMVRHAPLGDAASQPGRGTAPPSCPLDEARPRPGQSVVEEMPCGSQIEPLLYAIDVFVPLIDLRQESKCTVSTADGAWLWRLFKAAFAILGALMIPMAVLTVSGVLRRNVER